MTAPAAVSPERLVELIAAHESACPCRVCSCGLQQTAAALRELQARREADAWRPIATAPRDGTRILACEATVGYAVVGHFRGEHFTDGAFPMIPVTHWRPLPAPPTVKP